MPQVLLHPGAGTFCVLVKIAPNYLMGELDMRHNPSYAQFAAEVHVLQELMKNNSEAAQAHLVAGTNKHVHQLLLAGKQPTSQWTPGLLLEKDG